MDQKLGMLLCRYNAIPKGNLSHIIQIHLQYNYKREHLKYNRTSEGNTNDSIGQMIILVQISIQSLKKILTQGNRHFKDIALKVKKRP